MNEDNTSLKSSDGEKITKTKPKKRIGLFGKKAINHSQDKSIAHSNSAGRVSSKSSKPKKNPKKVMKSVARWIKKNRLVAIVILLLITLTAAATVWYFNTRPQPRVLDTNNQVITEFKNKLPELQKAASADANSAAARKNYAVALYVTGNYEAAKSEYEAVVKLDGKDSTAYNNLGNTYRDLGQYDKAKGAYQKSFEINPTSINPYVNLANVQLYTLGDSGAAIATYQKALKAMPNNNQISLLLGMAYEKAGKTTEAKQTFQDILTRDADDKAAKAGLDRLNK